MQNWNKKAHFGFVYVITTRLYEKEGIYKIGCTKNLENRLKSLNGSRLKGDKYYVKVNWRTFDYFKLESVLHNLLSLYKLHNEFYKCSLDTIIKTLSEYFIQSYRSFVYDLVYAFAVDKNVKWVVNELCFYYNERKISEKGLVRKLKKYMKPYDRYNFNQFVNDEIYYDYIEFLKKFFPTEYYYISNTYIEDLFVLTNSLCGSMYL